MSGPRNYGVYVRLVSFMRAAFPFKLRRKYSFARRTRAERTTSTLEIVGEWSGKIRSTPWPNDTLRTVNEARVPPRCMPMTTPSKIWMRSLSPSRTLTCTLTVSPDFIAGRSASCGFSTNSIALMTRSFKLSQQLRFLVVQTRGVQQVRPPLQRPAQRFALSPPPDLGMVARQQHVGNAEIADLGRPRVLRMVQQPATERIL